MPFQTQTTGGWQSGIATHYGPFPGYPAANEAGYQPNDVGVGCSNGQPGGDPRWLAILAKGTKTNPLLNSTVWPLVATVAVAQSAWGFSNKEKVCFQPISIRAVGTQSTVLNAYIVDFCPAAGCNWSSSERPFAVDLYGQDSWVTLGGTLNGSKINVEVKWPPGLVALSSQTKSRLAWNKYSFFTFIVACWLLR